MGSHARDDALEHGVGEIGEAAADAAIAQRTPTALRAPAGAATPEPRGTRSPRGWRDRIAAGGARGHRHGQRVQRPPMNRSPANYTHAVARRVGDVDGVSKLAPMRLQMPIAGGPRHAVIGGREGDEQRWQSAGFANHVLDRLVCTAPPLSWMPAAANRGAPGARCRGRLWSVRRTFMAYPAVRLQWRPSNYADLQAVVSQMRISRNTPVASAAGS